MGLSMPLTFVKITGVLILPVAVLLSCAKPSGDSAPAPQAPPQVEAKISPTIQSIQHDFVDKKCLSCHGQATERNRYVALSDLGSIMDVGSHSHHPNEMRRDLIKPGCPKQSFFLSIMREGKMPRGEKVDEETLKTIEQWITGLKPDAGSTCNFSGDEPPDTAGQ